MVLTSDQKKVVEYKSDGHTIYNRCGRYSLETPGKRLGDQRKNQDHPNHDTVKITKSLGLLMRFDVT